MVHAFLDHFPRHADASQRCAVMVAETMQRSSGIFPYPEIRRWEQLLKAMHGSVPRLLESSDGIRVSG
jgi:hypothetical protein